MKKTISTIFLTIMILILVGVVLIPQQANASLWDAVFCIFGKGDCMKALNNSDIFMGFLAELGNTVLTTCSYFLSIIGIILNISILLTMNIKAIYEATPAIDQVWILIRNISSIFIIFALIYTSITTILDIGKPDVKGLVGKIIMAGLLINFSLFFTKLAIDGSNLISLQFYRAIVPNSTTISFDKGNISSAFTNAFKEGGISNIFMQSLKIPSVYNNKKGTITADNHLNLVTIATATIGGSLLMIFAGLSFLAAAIAFSVRLVLLLLLMGFSPIYFAGMIFPQVEKEISSKWFNWLKQQLLFMPAYLLFMYIAMRFIGDQDGKGFFDVLNDTRTGAGDGQKNGILLSAVGLYIQYGIAFILINIPLIAATQLGGIGVEWGNTAKKWAGDKLKAGRIGTWRNTGGMFASKIADSNLMKNMASKNVIASGALKGVRGVASSYNENVEKEKSNKIKFGESLGYDKNAVYQQERFIKNKRDQIAGADPEIARLNGLINDPTVIPMYKKRYQAELAARKKVLNTEISNAERAIVEEKNKRKDAYSTRLDPRDVDEVSGKPRALSPWEMAKKGGYVSESERKSSAKLSSDTLKDELKLKKDLLDDKKKEVTDVKGDIKDLEKKSRSDTGLSVKETDELNKLKIKLTNLNSDPAEGVDKIESDMRDIELEIKRVDNLT